MKFERFCDHIYVLRTPFGAVTSAVTLVEGKEGCTLIDSGANDETVRSCILPALREFGADGRDMRRLLCTHTHGDHIGGHFMLKQLFPDMEIVVTERQAPKVADPLLYNIRIRSVYPAYSAPPSYGLRGVAADRVLMEGGRVAGLVSVPAAGHDDDCVGWLHEASGTLISGDALQGGGTETQGIALYFDLDAYRKTLERMEKIGAERILAAHDFRLAGAQAESSAACRAYIDCCRAVTEEYDRILHEIGSTGTPKAAEILIERTGGKMPEYLFLAMYTVDAHYSCTNMKRKEKVSQ